MPGITSPSTIASTTTSRRRVRGADRVMVELVRAIVATHGTDTSRIATLTDALRAVEGR